MILTNRELFLFVVCTVFYITLFILVLQSNRRKIQLLQSRLDNIHAMQKLAVMERGRGDVKLYSLYAMSEQDLHVSLLIKVRVQPKDIATLTAHSKESVASTRRRLYQKVFGRKGSTHDWDDFVLSI